MVYDKNVPGTNSGGVRAEGLGKRYGDLWALRGLDLAVPAGSVLGLLGHNGAGKTTALRILTTLAVPTEGTATVAGHDVVTAAGQVRACIGVAGQAATVDGLLTTRANLEMVARLYRMSRADAKKRAAELLEQLELTEVADKLVKALSGGMKRRADLAASLVARPPVLFLDEPTTGLDPHSRNQLWDVLRAHVKTGATLVLTTQDLEEADRLADDIVVLDHGTVAAHGTPAALKAQFGGERIVITLVTAAEIPRANAALAPFLDGAIAEEPEERRIIVPVRTGTRLVEVMRALDAAGLDAHDIQRREVTLDDVFLAITHKSRNAISEAA
jgi:ABC-2 type transport system ATP-binding protein